MTSSDAFPSSDAGVPTPPSLFRPAWLAHDVLIPFVISRVMMLLVIWVSQLFLGGLNASPAQLPFGERLFYLSTMWDASWYMSIITDGYQPPIDLTAVQSNLPFFPLFPQLVRLLALLLPGAWRTVPTLALIGVLLSNILAVSALAIIHRLAYDLTSNRDVARRTVLYLLIFPTSFYLSLFYAEATFLFFTVFTIWAGLQKRWLMAGVLAGFVVLSRPLGILILLVLLWLYLQERRIHLNGFRALDRNIIWLGIAPAVLSLYLWYHYQLTGDFLAPFTAQQAWGRAFVWSWQSLAISWPVGSDGYYLLRLNQLFLFAFIGLGLLTWRYLPFAFTLLSLLHLLPSLASGSFDSTIRHCLMVFPIFIMLAIWGKSPTVNVALVYLFVVLQTLLLAAWSQGYWVV